MDDLTKENARIKQVLKENRYHEIIINKILKTVTDNDSLSQSQQQTQATDIQDEEISRCTCFPHVSVQVYIFFEYA